MFDEIRADYKQLAQVAAQFKRQASAINQMNQRVKRSMRQVERSWKGKGSQQFFAEMNEKVLPADERLYRALLEAAAITQRISQLVQQAEQDAASPFSAQ